MRGAGMGRQRDSRRRPGASAFKKRPRKGRKFMTLKELERLTRELEALAKCLQSESQQRIRNIIHRRAVEILQKIEDIR